MLTGTGNSGITPLRIAVDNVTVDGFTIEGNTSAANLGAGVFVNPSLAGLDLRNNIVQNNISGLQLANDTATNPAIIRNNVFRNNNQPGPVSGTGIYSDQFVSGGQLANVTIADNTFSGNQNVAVLLGATTAASQSGVTVSGNTMTSNGNGILLFNTASATMANNSISGSLGSQVLMGGGVNGAAITGNLIQNGMARGVRIGDFGGGSANQNLTLSCNAIQGNTAAGLEIAGGAGQYTAPSTPSSTGGAPRPGRRSRATPAAPARRSSTPAARSTTRRSCPVAWTASPGRHSTASRPSRWPTPRRPRRAGQPP